MASNYFTCTLGEAQTLSSSCLHNFQTVNDLIDHKAFSSPNAPAVGFPTPRELFSYKELRDGSITIAARLKEAWVQDFPDVPVRWVGGKEEQICIALLCPSSIDFLFVWLGLMRLSCSVLLIAPQLKPEAIASLLEDCSASLLIYYESYHELASGAILQTRSHTHGMLLSREFWTGKVRSPIRQCDIDTVSLHRSISYKLTSHSTAYIHHTSGTTTGRPKPIPQTHHAAIGVLPCLPTTNKATFTTTPLYHGGIADCFRAWSSGELIWLFPATRLAITEQTIKDCFEEAAVSVNMEVRYFSSVPYILQMLASNEETLQWLQRMDIVGVGGAALPQDVGNALVEKGMSLVSRFGSSECGFLLSSHRNYETDREWQYLRPPNPSPYLKFEQQKETPGLYELIVLKGWPIEQKSNRPDLNFATGDLFQQHETTKGLWKYHSRSGGSIALTTGKKFDPAPIEDMIAASSAKIKEVLVFGDGENVPGVLVFVNEGYTDTGVSDEVWAAVESANSKSEAYARIDREMVVIMRTGSLTKSSKGTPIRTVAAKDFARWVEEAYERGACRRQTPGEGDAVTSTQDDKSTKEKVRSIIRGEIGRDLDDGANFFDNGLDSRGSTSIRNTLQKLFLTSGDLPWNVVYDCGNIVNLSKYIDNLKRVNDNSIEGSHGSASSDKEREEKSKHDEMIRLVDKYSPPKNAANQGQIAVLTGATGALGAHVLKILLENQQYTQVWCLVRASTNREAHDRVMENLNNRRIVCSEHKKLQFVASSLYDTSLGMDPKSYSILRERATLIIHTAWPVNFLLPLSTFETSIQGLANLLTLCRGSKYSPTFVFCSSTASVMDRPSKPIPEQISTSPTDSSPIGYAKSKWAAELVCQRSHKANPHLKIKIARIGQLTGDTTHGIWNTTEAYPLMLSTMRDLKCLPAINDVLDWLPLDVAAKAIIEIALPNDHDQNQDSKREPQNVEVYHIINKHTTPTFKDILAWAKAKLGDKREFDIVEPQIWMDRLEALKEHPAKSLLGFWREIYGQNQKAEGGEDRGVGESRFATEKAEKKSEVMRKVKPLDVELVEKIWTWLNDEVKV